MDGISYNPSVETGPANLSQDDTTANVISIEQLQRLVRLLDTSDVSELELKRAGEGTHLVLRKAGVDSQLLVYEALPHAFWYHFELPETREALNAMAGFFAAKLGY